MKALKCCETHGTPVLKTETWAQVIIKCYRDASRMAIAKLKEWAIDISGKDAS